MRTITIEQIKALQDDPAYRLIVEAKPDHTRLEKDAKDFALWIAKQHELEAAKLRRKAAFA